MLARTLITILLLASATAQADHLQSLGKLPRVVQSSDSVALSTISKPIVVQFWATWCKTCGETMALLDKQNQQDWQTNFYTVAVDDEASAVKAYLAKVSLQSAKILANTFIDADAKFAKQCKVSALPHIVVMSSTGEILMRHIGHPEASVIAKMRGLILKSESSSPSSSTEQINAKS